jgi:serine/threonine protein kinase
VLVLRRLVPTRYDTMRGSCDSSVASLWKFSMDALSALCAIHAAGWAHCDIKPSAIMMNANTKQCVYSDFNLARRVSTPIDRHKGLPGTAGWVFDESPVSTAAEVDRVGLGAVFGWLLNLEEFGDPDASYADAVRGLHRHHHHQQQQSLGGSIVKAALTPRERLLRVVEKMLQLPAPSCPLQSLLETMTKEDHRSRFDRKLVAFPTEKENCIVANPSLTLGQHITLTLLAPRRF